MTSYLLINISKETASEKRKSIMLEESKANDLINCILIDSKN